MGEGREGGGGEEAVEAFTIIWIPIPGRGYRMGMPIPEQVIGSKRE